MSLENQTKNALILAIASGSIAGILQLSSVFVQEKVPPRTVLFAAVIIATFMGVATALMLYVQFKWTLVTAGVVGAATGFIPGARWVGLAQKALEMKLKEEWNLQLEEKKKEGEDSHDA